MSARIRLATDPPVSEKQRKAMFAARAGKSTLGIPKKIGAEFVGKGKDRLHPALRKARDELALMIDTLYVYRPLKNGEDFRKWAKAQRFLKTLSPDDMHVTVVFSKTPVDWSMESPATAALSVPNKGARTIEQLGDKGAVVMRFESDALARRWQQFRNIGCTSDYPDYKPHVTISYDAGDVDLGSVVPFDGPLEFGSEVFQPVNDKWLDKAKRAQDSFAFDRGSARSYSADGHLHVSDTNISKGNVCPYLGREIPDFEKLGLDPDREYMLLRHPEELAKAVDTFNNKPLLSKHVPVTSDDHPKQLVVGSTGTNAHFDAPYLKNDIVVWDGDAIKDVEDESKKELSSAYRYRADMTPGTYEGEKYDGVMRDIVGNHVALVNRGRAGPDVMVGDLKKGMMDMSKVAIATGSYRVGGLIGFLQPRLAQDADIDFSTVFKKVTGPTYAKQKKTIAADIKRLVKGKLAQDATVEGLASLLDTLECPPDGSVDAETSTTPNGGTPAMGKAREFLKGKLSAEDMATCETLFETDQAKDAKKDDKDDDKDDDDEAEDEDDPDAGMDDKDDRAEDDEDDDKDSEKDKDRAKDKKAKDKKMGRDDPPAFKGMPKVGKGPDKAKDKAMDAALMRQQITNDVKATFRGIREAEDFVRPYVGKLGMSFDSAEEVYGATLKARGVNIKGVPAAAYRAMVALLPKAGAQRPGNDDSMPAMDSSGEASFKQLFPDAQETQFV